MLPATLDDDGAVLDHEHSRAGVARDAERLTGRDIDLDSHLLDTPQRVLGEAREERERPQPVELSGRQAR